MKKYYEKFKCLILINLVLGWLLLQWKSPTIHSRGRYLPIGILSGSVFSKRALLRCHHLTLFLFYLLPHARAGIEENPYKWEEEAHKNGNDSPHMWEWALGHMISNKCTTHLTALNRHFGIVTIEFGGLMCSTTGKGKKQGKYCLAFPCAHRMLLIIKVCLSSRLME